MLGRESGCSVGQGRVTAVVSGHGSAHVIRGSGPRFVPRLPLTGHLRALVCAPESLLGVAPWVVGS